MRFRFRVRIFRKWKLLFNFSLYFEFSLAWLWHPFLSVKDSLCVCRQNGISSVPSIDGLNSLSTFPVGHRKEFQSQCILNQADCLTNLVFILPSLPHQWHKQIIACLIRKPKFLEDFLAHSTPFSLCVSSSIDYTFYFLRLFTDSVSTATSYFSYYDPLC